MQTSEQRAANPNGRPVDELVIGGVAYTRDDLVRLLDSPRDNDASLALAAQLIGARLNIAAGIVMLPDISVCLDAAEMWMADHADPDGRLPFGLLPSVFSSQTPSGPQYCDSPPAEPADSAEMLASVLADFNSNSTLPCRPRPVRMLSAPPLRALDGACRNSGSGLHCVGDPRVRGPIDLDYYGGPIQP